MTSLRWRDSVRFAHQPQDQLIVGHVTQSDVAGSTFVDPGMPRQAATYSTAPVNSKSRIRSAGAA